MVDLFFWAVFPSTPLDDCSLNDKQSICVGRMMKFFYTIYMDKPSYFNAIRDDEWPVSFQERHVSWCCRNKSDCKAKYYKKIQNQLECGRARPILSSRNMQFDSTAASTCLYVNTLFYLLLIFSDSLKVLMCSWTDFLKKFLLWLGAVFRLQRMPLKSLMKKCFTDILSEKWMKSYRSLFYA